MTHDETPSGAVITARLPDGSEVNITEGVMAMYDLVISSMDWGSGFWTFEDALPVVHVAKTCGFAKCEEAERYVDAQRHSAEQSVFLRTRLLPVPMPATHEHVYSSMSKCMWPGCREVRDDV